MNTVTNQTQSQSETEIRNMIADWQKAVTACDVPKVMTYYAPNVLAFDAVGKLQFKGAKAYGAHWQACIDHCKGPMTFEVHELGVTAAKQVAFGHYVVRCGGEGPDGAQHTSWLRATACFQKLDGQWKIVHEHFSAPFEMPSGKALFDLQP